MQTHQLSLQQYNIADPAICYAVAIPLAHVATENIRIRYLHTFLTLCSIVLVKKNIFVLVNLLKLMNYDY